MKLKEENVKGKDFNNLLDFSKYIVIDWKKNVVLRNLRNKKERMQLKEMLKEEKLLTEKPIDDVTIAEVEIDLIRSSGRERIERSGNWRRSGFWLKKKLLTERGET